MYFVIIRLTFILILIFLINTYFNIFFALQNYHIFYVNVEGDDLVVADQ